MPRPGTMRLGPTAFATGNKVVIWAAGIPAFSISCVIAAPLRVLVPQVEVRITASTWGILQPRRYFSAQAPAVLQGVIVAGGGHELGVEPADQPALLHFSKHIHGHQTIRVCLDVTVVIAAMDDLIIRFFQIVPGP